MQLKNYAIALAMHSGNIGILKLLFEDPRVVLSDQDKSELSSMI